MRTPVLIAALGCVLATGCGADEALGPDNGCLPGDHFLCGRPRNLAHRGGANLRPENTLVAFSNAVAIGADVLELDVQRTTDDVIVVIHDATVDRTTEGTGALGTLTFAEVEQLDAGYWFTTDGGVTYPYRGMGIRVPTLAQVLEAFPSAYFSIEIKDSTPTVSPVLALISSLGLEDQVVIASFSDNVLVKVRTDAPSLLTTMSLGEMVEFANLTNEEEASYLLPAPIIQVPVEQVTEEILARARRHHLVVQAWTVDDDVTMHDLLARGVDGIITNAPDRLQAIIGSMSGS